LLIEVRCGAFFLKTTRLYSSEWSNPTSAWWGMHRGMRTERAGTVQRDRDRENPGWRQ